jgi:hypothetical protein
LEISTTIDIQVSRAGKKQASSTISQDEEESYKLKKKEVTKGRNGILQTFPGMLTR